MHRSAHNEKHILQDLDSSYVNKYIGFYEDLILSKTYLVLESAGNKSLADFVPETRASNKA